MGIFNFKKRGKGMMSLVGIMPDSPGIVTASGYHMLAEAPEVDSAIRTIADLIGVMPIHLMENTNNGDVRVRDQLARKIDIDPWSLGTRQTWVSWIAQTMLSTGQAVVIPVTQNGLIADLVPAPNATFYRPYGSKTYYIRYKGEEFDAGNVLHFRLRTDPDFPWLGIGPEVQLQQVVDSIVQTAATKTAYMSSEYKPPIIIAVNADSALADEKERSMFTQQYLKRKDKSEPWILPADLMTVQQVKPLSLTDLAIKDGVELDKRTVASILDIPVFLLGIGSFNREEYNAWISRRIKTIATTIEQEMTKKLLYSESRYFRMNARALYSYSLNDLSAIAINMRSAGMMTGNEGRNWLNLPPMDGLDELVMLENYIPSDRLGDQNKLSGNGRTGDEKNAE